MNLEQIIFNVFTNSQNCLGCKDIYYPFMVNKEKWKGSHDKHSNSVFNQFFSLSWTHLVSIRVIQILHSVPALSEIHFETTWSLKRIELPSRCAWHRALFYYLIANWFPFGLYPIPMSLFLNTQRLNNPKIIF